MSSSGLSSEVSRGFERVVALAWLTRLFLYFNRRIVPAAILLAVLVVTVLVACNDPASTSALRFSLMLAALLGTSLSINHLVSPEQDGTGPLVRAGVLAPAAPAVAVLLTLELLQTTLGLSVLVAAGITGAITGYLSWSAAVFLGVTTAGGGTFVGVLALCLATFACKPSIARRTFPYSILTVAFTLLILSWELPEALSAVWQGTHIVLVLLVLFVVSDVLAALGVWLWQWRVPHPELTEPQRAFLAETLGVELSDPLLDDAAALHRRVVHLPDGVRLWEGLTGESCLEFLDGMRSLVVAPPRRDAVLEQAFGAETRAVLSTRVEDMRPGQASALLRAWADSQDVEAYIIGKF